MAVIFKKEEKAEAIISMMTNRENIEDFKLLFKTTYPDDYAKMVKAYNAEERKDKKGKGHPMPHPEKYLSNMYKVAVKKMILQSETINN